MLLYILCMLCCFDLSSFSIHAIGWLVGWCWLWFLLSLAALAVRFRTRARGAEKDDELIHCFCVVGRCKEIASIL